MGSITEESLPSYDLSQSRDILQTGDITGEAGSNPVSSGSSASAGTAVGKRRTMSVESRVAWACALGVPLLAGVLLLFLITASSASLRVDFSVIQIDVSSPTLDALFGVMSGAGGGVSSGGPVTRMHIGTEVARYELARRAGEGFMMIGTWGWCVATRDYTR